MDYFNSAIDLGWIQKIFTDRSDKISRITVQLCCLEMESRRGYKGDNRCEFVFFE